MQTTASYFIKLLQAFAVLQILFLPPIALILNTNSLLLSWIYFIALTTAALWYCQKSKDIQKYISPSKNLQSFFLMILSILGIFLGNNFLNQNWLFSFFFFCLFFYLYFRVSSVVIFHLIFGKNMRFNHALIFGFINFIGFIGTAMYLVYRIMTLF